MEHIIYMVSRAMAALVVGGVVGAAIGRAAL
jgi:hypothetical protein